MSDEWKELFEGQRPTELALWVRRQGRFASGPPRALADDELLLLGGAGESGRSSRKPAEVGSPTCVALTPSTGQLPEEFQVSLKEARERYPGAELCGFGPPGWSAAGGPGLDRLVVKIGLVEETFTSSEDWQIKLDSSPSVPFSAVLAYSPRVTSPALQEAVRALEGKPSPASVIPLPLSAGDRIPLQGLTTPGTTDMMVISALRYLLPPEVRVRASWGALGWKVAQLALLYGADELAGWTAAEACAYTGRVRAAARVEEKELLQGLTEAGTGRRPWCPERAGRV